MDKKLLEESIKTVEEGIKVSKGNMKRAQFHVEEGELILKALKAEKQNL